MDNLYNNYTFCCGGNMNPPISRQSSNNEIRKYFLGQHNKKTFEICGRNFPFHMAIPYILNENSQIAKIDNRFSELKNIRQEFCINPIINHLDNFRISLQSLDEIIIVHAGLPVDTMSSNELENHLPQSHYESFSFREHVA